MSQPLVYGITAAVLVGLGLYGLLGHRDALRRVLSLNVTGVGVFLLLVALSARDGAADPVPRAMVLTGIVITLAATGVGLATLRQVAREAAEAHEEDVP